MGDGRSGFVEFLLKHARGITSSVRALSVMILVSRSSELDRTLTT